MFIWQHCRHGEVRWLDAYTCRCNECGKTGIWYEDGLVLWCKRRAVELESHDEASPSDAKKVAAGMPATGIRFPHIPPNDHSSAAVA